MRDDGQEILAAFVRTGLYKELGYHAFAILAYLTVRGKQDVKSLREFSVELGMNRRGLGKYVDALEDSKFITVRRTKEGLELYARLPQWITRPLE